MLAAGQPSSSANFGTTLQTDGINETQQEKLLAQAWAAEEFNSFLSDRVPTPIAQMTTKNATSVTISKDQTEKVDDIPVDSSPASSSTSSSSSSSSSSVHGTRGKAVKVIGAAKSVAVRKMGAQTQRLSSNMDIDPVSLPSSPSSSSSPAAASDTATGTKLVNAVVIKERQPQSRPQPEPEVRLQTKATRSSSTMYTDANGSSSASHSRSAQTTGAEVEAGPGKGNTKGESILSRPGMAGKKIRIISKQQFMTKDRLSTGDERGRGRGGFVAINGDHS